jgi:hypothetical protein
MLRWLDNLERWRSAHILLGVGALLPLWWHIVSAPVAPNPAEWLLLGIVILLVASGIFGTVIQDFFPHTAGKQGEHLVRIKDVDRELRDVLKASTDNAVGHGEEVEEAYHARIEPILYETPPFWRLLFSALRKGDPAQSSCAMARHLLGGFSTDEHKRAYEQLLQLAEHKVRLDQNRVSLQFTTGWLRYHILVAVMIGVLLVFHIVGAFLFAS